MADHVVPPPTRPGRSTRLRCRVPRCAASEPRTSTSPERTGEQWVTALRSAGARRDAAVAELHTLLLRAARFEVGRRRHALAHASAGDVDDLAQQAADDALVAVLAKLDSFRGDSRFTTWAYKFALLEAAVKVRRQAWRHREVTLDADDWSRFPDALRSPAEAAESTELLVALRDGIRRELTPHQREVLVALALNEVPIDVLAERLGTTRGALYKTLHDARRKLRTHLAATGMTSAGSGERRIG